MGNGEESAADRRHVESVAIAWRLATDDIAYTPLPTHDIHERFEQLAAAALAAVRPDTPREITLEQGRSIGRALVGLNLIRPEALERTLACLGTELAGATAPQQLGMLLAGIAGGFIATAETAILAQQEAIGQAATLALRHAQSELAASRDRLAETNRELSDQIDERTRAEQAQRALTERLSRLREIDLAILSAESLPAIVNISVDYIRALIPAIIVNMLLLDVANRRSIVLSSTNAAYPVGRDMEITLTGALEQMRGGEIVYLADMRRLRPQSPGIAEVVELGGRSLMAVPLRFQEELLGGLVIILGEVREFSQTEIDVAREIADSVAVAFQNQRLLEAERAAREREEILREVAASLTLGLEQDALLHLILDQLDRVMLNHSSAILLIQDGVPTVVAHRGPPALPERLNELIRIRPLSISSVIESGQLKLINDTHASPEWTIIEGFEYIRAWIGVPLLVKGECIGVMTIDRNRPDAFTAQDQDMAMTFANQAAIAIDNVRMFTRLQAYAGQLEEGVRVRTRDLEVLYGITATAVSNPEMDNLLRRSLQLMVDAFECPAAAVLLLDGETKQLQPPVLPDGVDEELSKLWQSLPPDHPLLARPLQNDKPAVARGAELPAGWGREADLIAVTASLRSRGRKFGVLCLLWDDPRRYDAVPETLLVTIADQIGAAVENIRFHQIIRQTAIIEERERLARDIHDQVNQSIYSAGLFAEAARDAAAVGNLPKVRQHTGSILRMTNEAMRELRLLMFELRTEALARRGLVDALRERLRTVEHRLYIDGEVHAPELGEIPVAVEEAFYRIALEALSNALRHAHADRVDITFVVEAGELVMTIADDGIGFDQDAVAGAGGMGLVGMHNRIDKINGVLSLNSGKNGTQVIVRAPLEP